MPKLIKNKSQVESTRNRARFFRNVQSILRKGNDQINYIRKRSVPQFFKEQPIDQQFITEPEKESSLADKLRSWALEFNVTRRAITSLLKILKFSGMSCLPNDCRTLLQTPRVVHIENVAGGKYWHHGLKIALETLFSSLNKNIEIKLNINADGLPLFKSSAIEFWPLLANIRGLYVHTTHE